MMRMTMMMITVGIMGNGNTRSYGPKTGCEESPLLKNVVELLTKVRSS